MKTLFFVMALLVSSIAIAQTPTVTITTTGNRIKQVVVDNKSYAIDNSTAGEKSFPIADLSPGSHSLEIIRTNQSNPIKSSFTLREGYDLALTLNADGSVSTYETRIRRDGNAGQLSTTAFNRLYTQTRNKTGATARTTFLENHFNTNNKRMTSRQASQLIQLVNSESMRLKLAKLSYSKVSDQLNFSLVTNLLNSTNSRNDLNNYIAALQNDVDSGTPITASQYRTIYNEVLAETTTSERVYYLNNFFTRDFNYYTTAQAKQLIQTISGESDRLTLAKAAYRGVTDKEIYYNNVYTLLSSSSGRSQLVSYINTYSNNTGAVGTVKTPMVEADFNSMYRDVQFTFGLGAKYNSLTNIFNTETNYFTVNQAKQLIQLVSSESNRLELAKLSYNNVTDPTNFKLIFDLFSQENQNELKAYVGSVSTIR